MSTQSTSPEPHTDESRAAINRANSQLSTGPSTPAGKDRIKYNALTHGCYSAIVVFPYEDHAAYEAIGAKMRADFQPSTPAQQAIVQDMQDTAWRLQRVLAIEANLHTVGANQQLAAIDEQFGPDLTKAERYALAQAAAFQINRRTFEQLSRQEGRLRRVQSALVEQISVVLEARRRRANAPPAAPARSNIPDGFVPAPIPQMPTFTGPMADIKRKHWLRQHGLAVK